MQWRDALVQVVFDVFHEPGIRPAAEGFQVEMRNLLDAYSAAETFEHSAANGTQLDMQQVAAQDLYYDKP